MHWSSTAEKLPRCSNTHHPCLNKYLHPCFRAIELHPLFPPTRNSRYDSARQRNPLPYITMHFTTCFHIGFGMTRALHKPAYQNKVAENKPTRNPREPKWRKTNLPFSVAKCSEITRDHLHIKQWSLFITKMTKIFDELQIFQS